MATDATNALRIDRWLWFVRLYRTRVLASRAVSGGHVRINGERARPGQRVRPGDRLDIVRDQLPYALDVVSIPSRRGPASDARLCYAESEAAAQKRQRLRDGLRADRRQMPRTDGRPDKRTRRQLRQRQRDG